MNMQRNSFKRQHVLDIGCGEGYGAHLLAQHAKDVHAIDKHKRTIQKAQREIFPTKP